MKQLIKPHKLNKGDIISTVSLSWGGAGDKEIRWRYEQGKRRLEEIFGLKVIEMPNTLKGSDYLYSHPEKRAEDLMAAFSDTSVKGIFSCIGGDDTIRLLPFIDFSTIHNNPKIFMGYSDTTVNHFMCYNAGLSSIYGGCILCDFAENIEIPQYTIDSINKTLFTNDIIGNIPISDIWTSEMLLWEIKNKDTKRNFNQNRGYEILQGNGKIKGRLIGGCLEVMEFIKGTVLFPDIEDFDNTILFLETSEDCPSPEHIRWWMRNYGAMGILERINGMLISKPLAEKYYDDYISEYCKVLSEYGREDMPVLYNASFGHCEPKHCIPYGAMAEIDCDNKRFSILESACI